MKKLIPAAFFCTLAFLSCKKPIEYPIIPAIDFKSISIVNDANGKAGSVDVNMGMTDGDGDVGYHSVESGLNDAIFDDPNSIYYTNYKVKTYHLKNGTWDVDTIDLSARLEYLTPEGSNKAIKCEILRNLPVRPGLNRDTFYYEIFIYDRALHQSNTIKTDKVVLTTQ
ncbi:MAG: hypothetical protein IPP51_10815 [Bacteroidetes bacterium]|nr:hypothetical protein [Bacteroidota bacterium]